MAEENRENQGITKITVSGFKSLRDQSSIEVRPLTILAGANSSGKSSIMQPLLLMKQTLEAPYDPGPVLLNGSNIKFTSTEQFLSRLGESKYAEKFEVKIELDHNKSVTDILGLVKPKRELQLLKTNYRWNDSEVSFWSNMTQNDVEEQLGNITDMFWALRGDSQGVRLVFKGKKVRQRCFYTVQLDSLEASSKVEVIPAISSGLFANKLTELIHVPGVRGDFERAYNFTPVVGPVFQGRFDDYFASVIYAWQENNDNLFNSLEDSLIALGLTSNIAAKRINDVQLELQVGRTLQSNSDDTVSVAEVGFGVSQVLPVLVALLVAEPGQLVYIEQPELHLHPRAQVALAQVLADAANLGVRVVVETHSALLINGVQTLIAQEKLAHDKVILHWFKRGNDGYTTIDSQEPDKYGAYGAWPEDFAEVQLEADSTYLDAVEKREFEDWNGNQKSEMPGD